MSTHSRFTGARLFKVPLDAPSPRKPGTWGDKSWKKIKNGMTYEQYLKAGGRRNDLQWDVERGHIRIEGAKKGGKPIKIAATKTPRAVKPKAKPAPNSKAAMKVLGEMSVGFHPVPKPKSSKKHPGKTSTLMGNLPAKLTGMPKKTPKAPPPLPIHEAAASPLDEIETEDMPL